MTLQQRLLKQDAETAILLQVSLSLVSAIAAMSSDGKETIRNLLRDIDDTVSNLEGILPPDSPQVKAFRQAVAEFRGALKRSNLLPP